MHKNNFTIPTRSMPLVVVCGRPCTGKTVFAEKLAAFLKDKSTQPILLINEESLRLPKKHYYQSNGKEKELRGALKGAVDHALTVNNFVILDSLNYIKGFRYELYCCARTLRTPHCVVWVAGDEKSSNRWNDNRLESGSDAYDAKTLADLRKRFEAPNETNRWDSPLFKVVSVSAVVNEVSSTDVRSSLSGDLAPAPAPAPVAAPAYASASASSVLKSSWKPKRTSVPVPSTLVDTKDCSPSDEKDTNVDSEAGVVWFSGTAVEGKDDLASFVLADACLESIFTYLSSAQAPVPNLSTLAPNHVQADLLYELDRISQRITHQIVIHQAEQVEGTPLHLLDFDRALTLHRHTAMAELQRLRGQWVKANAQHPPQSTQAIGASFVDFLAVHL